MLNRKQSYELLKKYLKDEKNLLHSIESEAIMRALAQRLNQDQERWGLLGLLHDIDWELVGDKTEDHLTKAPEILKEAGFDDEFIETVVSHGYGFECAGLQDKKRSREVEYALACAETVTGLIYAAVLVRPDKKIANMELKSLKKKFKDKAFAANCNREVIRECEQLGIEIDEFLQISLDAMKGIADQIGLA